MGVAENFQQEGRPQVLVHVSTYQGKPFWKSGFLSHSHMYSCRKYCRSPVEYGRRCTIAQFLLLLLVLEVYKATAMMSIMCTLLLLHVFSPLSASLGVPRLNGGNLSNLKVTFRGSHKTPNFREGGGWSIWVCLVFAAPPKMGGSSL